MALARVWIPSPNYSSRHGNDVRLIVLHSSEGAQTFTSLGSFFANPANQVSSHVGIDDTPGTVGEYVPRSGAAWTAAEANGVSIQAELCTPKGASANWDSAAWNSHPTMLANCAAWVAEEAAFYDIPIVKVDKDGRGVCQHSDLGAWGGGHVDLGPGFPIDAVLEAAAGRPPPPPSEGEDMSVPAPCVFNLDDGSQQTFYVDAAGRMMHHYWIPDRGWTGEGLSTGWDPGSELVSARSPQGAYQVWGVWANGRRAQVYWSGRQWITQPL